MRVKSWRGVVVGAFIALVLPLSTLLFASLILNGIVHVNREGSFMQTLTTIELTEIFLGPIGIVVAGTSAGLRGAVAWLALIIVAVPVLAFVWFLCAATLSGALGSPF